VYELPRRARKILGIEKIIALEVLDQIVEKALGFHLFEARVQLVEKPVVKARFEKKVMTPAAKNLHISAIKSGTRNSEFMAYNSSQISGSS
jgi:hypothetical protein